MENSNGRGRSFIEGANGGVRQEPVAVGQGEFHTQQQDLPEGFHLSSVLDKSQVLGPANGTSASDRARQTLTGTARNLNGQSEQTFEDQMWTSGVGRTRT